MKDNKTLKGIIIIGGLILILYMIFSDKHDYEILKESEMRNEKKELDIGLNTKISKNELNEITKELKKKYNSFERIYVWFHLKDKYENRGLKFPWASASLMNKGKWNIYIAANKEDEDKLKSNEVNGEIIGKWYVEKPALAYCTIIFRKNKKIFRKTFHTNTLYNGTMELRTFDNLKFNYVEEFSGEYYRIEENGNLGFYDKDNNLFLEAFKY